MAVVHRLGWQPGATPEEDGLAGWYERVDVDWPPLVERAVAARIPGHERLAERLDVLGATTAIVNEVPTDHREFAVSAVRNVTESVPTVAGLETAPRAILRG